jgi:Flp pilus assembly protein TadG
MKRPTVLPKKARQAGQNAVEFALVAPLVVGLLVGLLYAGFLLYCQITIANAARVGTNYLVRNPMAPDEEVEAVMEAQLGALDRRAITIEIEPPVEDRVPDAQVDVVVGYRADFPRVAVPSFGGGSPVVLVGPLNLRASSTLNVE